MPVETIVDYLLWNHPLLEWIPIQYEQCIPFGRRQHELRQNDAPLGAERITGPNGGLLFLLAVLMNGNLHFICSSDMTTSQFSLTWEVGSATLWE